MRGRCFKSTPSRRPYRLPSEKSQVNISESSPLSVHDENIADSVTEGVETAQRVISDVERSGTVAPVTSVHSHESSFYDEIFIPTPSHPPTTNIEVGQFACSPPIRSSIWVDPSVDDQHSIPNSDSVGESTENLGGNFDDHANQNPPNVDAHVKPTNTCTPDNVEPDLNV
ncbi:uncharacterized protein E5676_scaffold1567G00170 [Cucumis melo var. makuwa]|uniref:Envelope-like protein n=1 Tax=Cucumis melo var. makuwa TaxID=1194695 RepID=A0A5D3DR40_CUCMM|nr:uncharacterized protein E6C27_scaffold38G002370 [Cucumis melo var. makuwa]TYK26012.1 uncharacterized protein E5676_scaffold1567G00170 [Cucumis melo var. makuwa]